MNALLKRLPQHIITLIFCTILFSLTAAPARAGEVAPFLGFWEIPEPAGDTCIVIIKRGGRLSSFWAGSRSKEIVQGRYELVDGKLIAQWPEGHTDVFRMVGTDSMQRDTYYAGRAIEGDPNYQSRGIKVDSRMVGSLSVTGEPQRSRPEADGPAAGAPVRNTYIGYWKIEQSSGGVFGIGRRGDPHFFLNLGRNGQARIALRNWSGTNDIVGSWVEKDNAIEITWPNDNRDMLVESDSGYDLLVFNRGRSFSERPNERRKAVRAALAEAQSHFQAGEVRLLTTTDILGVWVPADSDGSKSYVEIENWGRAYRSPSSKETGSTPGEWRLLNDRVVITWIDGARDVIRMELRGFVQESFAAGAADGDSPAKSFAVRRFTDQSASDSRR